MMGIVGGFMVPHPPMIVPAVGRGGEAEIEETKRAYERVADLVAGLAPDTIVISSPHTVLYYDYFHISPGAGASGDFGQFRAPQVSFDVEYDEQFVKTLSAHAAFSDIAAGVLGEKEPELDHGTMVPLFFITQKYSAAKLVRIGLSGFSLATHYRMGMLIKRTAEELGRRVVYIASGDLSHRLKVDGPYGLDPLGPVYDGKLMRVMESGEFDRLLDFEENLLEKAAECGHRSFVMMAGALDRTEVEIEKLSYQDVTGVGYGICTYLVKEGEQTSKRAFLEKWEKRERARREEKERHEDVYVRLARRSLENYITKKERIYWNEVKGEILAAVKADSLDDAVETGEADMAQKDAASGADLAVKNLGSAEEQLSHGRAGEDDSEKLRNADAQLSHGRAGAFVSLHKNGQLRGCIGTIMATRETLADEIIENAISASTRDPRFSPVTEEELDELEYSVDVLGETEKITSEKELDVRRYGVIVTKGMKRGLLLPNLDGVDTVEEQLRIAKQKAGLSPEERECELERFEVVRHY